MLLLETTAVEELTVSMQIDGPRTVILPAKEFGGEHAKAGPLFIATLWLVSTMAMITNFVQALFYKVFTRRNVPLRKIIWELGRSKNHISSLFFDRFSSYNHQSKWGAAGWRSLDLFYNYHEKVLPGLNGDIEGAATRWWGRIENRQAVANRKKIVVDMLAKAFYKFAHEREIRILSIASGSAQAVIEAMLKCPALNVRAVLIDSDKSALEESRRLIAEHGLLEKFVILRGTPKKVAEICKSFCPQIIEMVGFMDYLPKETAINLVSEIHGNLVDNGLFITSNIKDNREKIFLDWVLLWPMIYRDEKELAAILMKGGFIDNNIDLVYEPFKIHGIAVCKKNNEMNQIRDQLPLR